MKIWIDGYEANVLQRLGSSQVAFELIRHLEEIDQVNDYTVLLPVPPLDDLPKERPGWKYRILKPKRLWTKIALPLSLYTSKQKPDLVFSPTHYIPQFVPGKVKRVATIFDLSFLHFPEMFTKKDLWLLKNGTKFSALNADHIITISRFSKEDICRLYNLAKEKITVAYPGYDREIFNFQFSILNLNKVKGKYKIGENYVIYIGTIQPRKNLVRLMEAFARVARQGNSQGGLELVIAGKAGGVGREGWMYEDILKAPRQLGIEEKVNFLGYVPAEDLTALLAGALAFVQPSLWEGFGIPVLEAMASGTPVICSNVSSLPEVAGKAGLLVDPYSVDQLEQAIRLITTDKKLRHKYSKLGLEQAQKFSWDKMAKEVLKVFEQVK